MKSSVYPTLKKGDFTGQGEIGTYLDLLGGNHRLVHMLARHSSKTNYLSTSVVALSHETYTCKHMLITGQSVLCSLSLTFRVDSYIMEDFF